VPTHADADPHHTPEAFIEAFLLELRRRNVSAALLDQAHQVLPRFLAHLREKQIHDLRAVSEETIEAYACRLAQHKTRHGRPLADATQLAHLLMIRRLFRFLLKRRWILLDPTKNLVLPRPKTLPRRVLTPSQARRLMNTAHRYHGRWWWPHVETRDHAVLETLYGTGIRRAECCRLDLGDLDLSQGQLLIRNGKGKKDRLVPLPVRARLALDAYVREARPAFVRGRRERALFTTWRGARLKPVTLAAMLKRRAKAAGLTVPLSPHVLRHTCATHLLRGGADVRHVQELLGHDSIDSTMRYTRVNVTDLAKVMARAHPRERDWERNNNRSR